MRDYNSIIALSKFENTMRLWEKYNIEYRTILAEYYFWLRIKKDLNITPVNKISQDELNPFPNIPFLSISDTNEAKEFLIDLCIGSDNSDGGPDEAKQLFRLNNFIQELNDQYIKNALIENIRTRISDYKRQIKYRDTTCSVFGYDPDKCTSGNHTRQHKVLASSRF